LAAIVIATLGLLGYVVTTLLSDRWKSIEEQAEEEHQRLFREEASEAVRERLEFVNLSSAQLDDLTTLVLAPFRRPAPLPPPREAPPSKEQIREEVRKEVMALEERLDRVEQRFPEEATLEKIASINDAILATKVEQLEKSVAELESRLLTKWDVAAIISAVVGLAGVIFSVANAVLK
jgi:hypothetical protein